ncbi:MAG: outer membrane protein assembly factor BamC [Betaproteobacteria bacterium]|nr:outer membrane protein assembly factor BamC [Betaproteobacteria bacterium]MBV9360792.1 outer membrane protein assembly factor BamC [Betaproteobacteria bacterium]
MQKRVAALASVLLLGACSSVNDWMDSSSKSDYKNVNTLPPLEVPPDLTSPTRDNRYNIPDSVTAQSSATLSRYEQERKEQKPAAIGGATPVVLPPIDRMHVERAGGQRWLVVEDQSPEKLWPVVRDFWQENGFLIKFEAPDLGVMETDWAESKAKVPQGGIRGLFSKALDQIYSTSERDKYRTRLDRAADGKSTEIYVSHRGMVEVYTTARDPQSSAPGDTRWQPREPDPELEAEFLRRLMMRLGAQEEKARTLTANAIPAQQRAEIRKGLNGEELLEVFEPFDRVWRRVGLALDRVGFTVEDRDRQKGIYFVRYADPESDKDDRSLFAKWFTSDPKVKAQQYRVQISQGGTTSQVNVLGKDGAADSSKTAQRILTLLHEQLK